MITVDCAQNSPEWQQLRLGIPTSSNFDKIIQADGKPSKQRTKYMYKLAGERISGVAENGYTNAAMERGKELEAEARKLYEFQTGQTVQQVGFCYYDECKLFGASPDGLVGKEGILEIKCPIITTHVGYLVDNVFPMDYWQQVQGQLYVTGAKWCDFMSYYPKLKPFIIRVCLNDEFITRLAGELQTFCAELDELVKKIN